MFKKYNINELFVAHIKVIYHENKTLKNNDNILLIDGMSYTYPTVLRKNNEKYYDLQNTSICIDIDINKVNNSMFSYEIVYLEPLSNYYTQEDNKKISKIKAYKIINNKK